MKNTREAEEMGKEGFRHLDENSETFVNTFADIAKKMLQDKMSPKEAMGLSNSYLEGIYAQAYRLYNTGKYKEAIHLFRLLVMFNGMEPKYLMGLAASLHMLKEYVDAIQTYMMCPVLDPTNPIPYYHASDCSVQMKDFVSAMVCLEMAIKTAGNQPQYASLKERAKLSLDHLKTQATLPPGET